LTDESHRQSLQLLLRDVAARGIRTAIQPLPPDTPMRFDGLSMTLRESHDPGELLYYLAHSLGSCAGWALDYSGVKGIFDELRSAKEGDGSGSPRFRRALMAFRQFEEVSASYGAWALSENGGAELVDDYSEFFRADLEAITMFHRTGELPAWRGFLASWHEAIAAGTQSRHPFPIRVIPPFVPRLIDVQEVKQGVSE
jgi:hypothetical protein